MSDVVFAFDFDGVVCDSVWERLFTGYNAFFDQLPEPLVDRSTRHPGRPGCDQIRGQMDQ